MNKVVVIVGPTAVGKTKLSIELAKKLDGEIINADSTQVYKGLEIATAKVTEKEMNGIKHHLLNIKELTEDYSVSDFQNDCRKKIDEILASNKTPIIVGGTGLYIKAALYNYEFSNNLISEEYNDLTNEELYRKLMEIDPTSDIHINNRKRVIRAINFFYENNIPFSKKEKSDELLYDICLIGLTATREELYARINFRVDEMILNGLVDEALDLYKKNIRTKAVMTPIGYRELFSYFDNEITLEEAIDKIKQNSRHYAKRQYTWFNNQMNVKWFNVDFSVFQNTIDDVIKYIEN